MNHAASHSAPPLLPDEPRLIAERLQNIFMKENPTMSEQNTNPVDFNNPEAIESELAAAESTETAKAPKEKKPAKPRMIKVTYTAERSVWGSALAK